MVRPRWVGCLGIVPFSPRVGPAGHFTDPAAGKDACGAIDGFAQKLTQERGQELRRDVPLAAFGEPVDHLRMLGGSRIVPNRCRGGSEEQRIQDVGRSYDHSFVIFEKVSRGIHANVRDSSRQVSDGETNRVITCRSMSNPEYQC